MESFTGRLEEIKPLFPLTWHEMAQHNFRFPMSPQYGLYLARDAIGEVLFVTLRDGGELVGYFLGFITPGLHYETCLTLTMDVLYLRADRPHVDAIGLFSFVEGEARQRGVHLWLAGAPRFSYRGALFQHLGFEEIEVYYSKWLGAKK